MDDDKQYGKFKPDPAGKAVDRPIIVITEDATSSPAPVESLTPPSPSNLMLEPKFGVEPQQSVLEHPAIPQDAAVIHKPLEEDKALFPPALYPPLEVGKSILPVLIPRMEKPILPEDISHVNKPPLPPKEEQAITERPDVVKPRPEIDLPALLAAPIAPPIEQPASITHAEHPFPAGIHRFISMPILIDIDAYIDGPDVIMRSSLWLDAEDGVETGNGEAVLRWISRLVEGHIASLHALPDYKNALFLSTETRLRDRNLGITLCLCLPSSCRELLSRITATSQ